MLFKAGPNWKVGKGIPPLVYLGDRGIDELMVLSVHPCLKFKSSIKQADVYRQTFDFCILLLYMSSTFFKMERPEKQSD